MLMSDRYKELIIEAQKAADANQAQYICQDSDCITTFGNLSRLNYMVGYLAQRAAFWENELKRKEDQDVDHDHGSG